MNKQGFAAFVVALIVAVLLVAAGGVWYWGENRSSQNLVQIASSTSQTFQSNTGSSTGDTAINDWKIYQNNQLGYTVKYPSTWSLSEKNDFAYFILPSDADPNPGKGGAPAATAIPVNVSITTSSYTNLVDYRNYIDSLVSSDDGNANWADSGLEQINGNTFFEYSWMHQAQAVDYAIADNGQVLTISFYMDDASLPFNQSISWADFQKFLSTFEIVGK